MPRLVALAVPGGPAYVEAIRRVWDAGDAFAPLDPRLPADQAERLLRALAPSAVMEADGQIRSLEGGQPVEPGDALILGTSGTTGQPKAVIHTHDSVRASALATSTALGVDPQTDRWLACIPLAHIGGLSVVLRSIVTDTPVDVHDGFDAEAAMEAAKGGVTLVSLVTRALNQIPAQLFRTILIGGAAPPADRPPNVIASYGLTETGSGVVYDRKPLDEVEIDIDGEGAVRVRGPMLFRGYRHDPNPFDAGGWFDTGDLGHWGDDGLLRIDGRAVEVINTGGEKVWPAAVESVLAEQPEVAQVAVVGRPDPDWGQRVVAVVVPTRPDAPPSLAQLRAVVKERLAPWCAPRELELRDELPTTSLGKISRVQLAAGA